jgi:hypothetical protein
MEPVPPPAPAPSSARPADPHRRITLVEILGYCGIAAGLFGTFAVLEETSGDAQNTVMVTSLALAAVFLLAGALVGVDAPDRLARMRSACWFASVVGFATFVGLALEPDGRGGFAFLFAVSAIYALVLWALSPRLLQQLAFFSLALNTVAVLVGFPDLSALFFGPPDLIALALAYWVGGGTWFALGYLDLVRPPRSAMVLGMVFGLQGLLLLSQDSSEASALLILASSAVLLFLGGSRGDRAVTGVAVVGLLIGSFAFLGALEVRGTGPGLVTMLVGVVLLGIGRLDRQDHGAARSQTSVRRAVLAVRASQAGGSARAAPAPASSRRHRSLDAEGAFDLPGRLDDGGGVALRGDPTHPLLRP